jgi:hypothetical protein
MMNKSAYFYIKQNNYHWFMITNGVIFVLKIYYNRLDFTIGQNIWI